jgi:glycerol kinase
VLAIYEDWRRNMRARLSGWTRLAPACTVLLTYLAGCEETHVPDDTEAAQEPLLQGAKLLWNDEVVDEFAINKTFLMSDQVAILSYEDADGTRVEFHVYAQPECGGWAFGVSTREQVEALER